jgi:hypothetical protein
VFHDVIYAFGVTIPDILKELNAFFLRVKEFKTNSA